MSTPESDTSSSISVAILCGGVSRRFGSEKALAMAKERPLCQWIMDRLAGVSDDMFLQMAPGATAPVDLPVNHDPDPGGGPKSGIHGALLHARHPRVFVVGSDMPNVDPRLPAILARHVGVDAVVPRWSNGWRSSSTFLKANEKIFCILRAAMGNPPPLNLRKSNPGGHGANHPVPISPRRPHR